MRKIAMLCLAGALALLDQGAPAATLAPIPGVPDGITEAPSQTIVKNFRRFPNSPRVLADAGGLTLYTYDADAPGGKSTCLGDCAAAWPPMLAPENAAAIPDWSLVKRSDGSRQWAYKGKPLYRFTKDVKPGDTAGDGLGGKWHVAAYEIPTSAVPPPARIGAKANAIAGGDVFVDYRGFTLYVMAGASAECHDDRCLGGWRALSAAQLAKPSGDWTIIEGNGRRQWAYKGQPVFTFDGDARPGDANGVFAGNAWRAAILRSYPTPAQVKLGKVGTVIIWTTADGMTLYARDRYQYEPGSFNADDGGSANINTGREIGTQGCDKKCPGNWQPFAAAAGAHPAGYWSILTREDGSRQWAYEGYALYTNTRDTKPGEMMGRDRFDLLDGTHAMYWRAANP